MKSPWILAALMLLAPPTTAPAEPLVPPASGKIPVAFLLSEGAVVIDFAGPWAVFEAVRGSPFELYTVSAAKKAIRASSGMQITPDFDLASAPRPKVIVIPAQRDHSPAVLDWVRKMTATTDVTMSVCTGAFLL